MRRILDRYILREVVLSWATVTGVLLVLLFTARAATQGQVWGTLTRQQISFLWGAQILLLYYVPQGIASFLSWSVGESYCRERWGRKLAAFDALFQGKWRNRTVATASLRGYAAGWAVAAATSAALRTGVAARASSSARAL